MEASCQNMQVILDPKAVFSSSSSRSQDGLIVLLRSLDFSWSGVGSIISITDPELLCGLIYTFIQAPLGKANFIRVVSWIKDEGVYFAGRPRPGSTRETPTKPELQEKQVEDSLFDAAFRSSIILKCLENFSVSWEFYCSCKNHQSRNIKTRSFNSVSTKTWSCCI